ncbi:hypothetical protein L3H42_11365, partial [Corynebacterium sp. MC-13]|nr:hypothetical protein [Corynebacterium parakroppenstedtii]
MASFQELVQLLSQLLQFGWRHTVWWISGWSGAWLQLDPVVDLPSWWQVLRQFFGHDILVLVEHLLDARWQGFYCTIAFTRTYDGGQVSRFPLLKALYQLHGRYMGKSFRLGHLDQ